jgi:hypothetical protein
LQRELSGGFLIDLSYVGTKGTRLFASEDGNPLVTQDLRVPVPANVSTTRREARLDQLQGQRSIRTNGGSSTYHAGQFEVRRRFTNGFGFGTAYTFSKVIDNGSEIFSYGNTSNLLQSGVPSLFGGLPLDRAIGFLDRTHRLVLNGQDTDGLGGGIFDRPNLNPNGAPGTRAVPNANSPTGYVNPDNGNAPIDPSQARYIVLVANTGAQRTPFGTAGRNTERGPGIKNWDFNIMKNIRVTERAYFEFRTEFFNIFNTPMYGKVSVSPFALSQNAQIIPANAFSSPAGQFLNETIQDGGGRVIRWQLRLHF